MTQEDLDRENMARARNRVLYDGYKNSLIEWTLSGGWTEPNTNGNDGKRLRGFLRELTGFSFWGNEIHGEIRNAR